MPTWTYGQNWELPSSHCFERDKLLLGPLGGIATVRRSVSYAEGMNTSNAHCHSHVKSRRCLPHARSYKGPIAHPAAIVLVCFYLVVAGRNPPVPLQELRELMIPKFCAKENQILNIFVALSQSVHEYCALFYLHGTKQKQNDDPGNTSQDTKFSN